MTATTTLRERHALVTGASSGLGADFARELAVVVREKRSLRALDKFWKSLPSRPTGEAIPQTLRDAQSGGPRRV